MKTVLFVHHSAELYGSDKMLLALVRSLSPGEFFPIVFLPATGPLFDELAAIDVECHVVPIARLSRSTLSFKGIFRLIKETLSSVSRFRAVLKGRDIDLIHSNTLSVLSGAFWARLNKIPHIWHVHEIIVRPTLAKKVYAFLLKHFADQIICASGAIQANLHDTDIALCAKSHVVWNGLPQTPLTDTKNVAVTNYRQDLGIDRDCVVITLVGRINRWKGQKLFVEAADLLWDMSIRNVAFLIVGSAPPGQDHFIEELEASIKDAASMPRIFLQKFTPDIYSIWSMTDIAVIPSIEPEPFGIVALEAMAMSKPIVASDSGGLAEIIINEETGLLVPPGHAHDLANALAKLIESPGERRRMGEHGLQRLRHHFTLSRYAGKIQDIYRRTLCQR